MEHLTASVSQFETYPCNLVDPDQHPHALGKYVERLIQNRDRLFCHEPSASVHFLDLTTSATEFAHGIIRNLQDMRNQLGLDCQSGPRDPLCRFIFIQAPNARSKLNITRNMLLLALSHHQVMPGILDFIFPFGDQTFAQDFYFGGFRHESRLGDDDRGLQIPNLGRSGRSLQICFNLKGVEPSPGQEKWPWSIRQAALYNSFDIETGYTTWIIVKANSTVRKRIMAATASGNEPMANSYKSPAHALSSILRTLLLLSSCAGENWQEFITFLENKLYMSTRATLAACVDDSTPLFESNDHSTFVNPASPTRQTTLSGIGSKIMRRGKSDVERTQVSGTAALLPPEDSSRGIANLKNFSFNDMPRLQFIEDKANEALLVLKANVSILMEIKWHYISFIQSDECAGALKLGCATEVRHFDRRISAAIGDMEMQQSRLETLLRLLAGRKSLLLGILDYRNTVINKDLSQRAATSANDMAEMTYDMHLIAKKTERETVSMRVITLVTLFFLPGTYISTLMSTDIIKFDSSDGVSREAFSSPALKLYLTATIPLTFVTFLGWWLFYQWADRWGAKGDEAFEGDGGGG